MSTEACLSFLSFPCKPRTTLFNTGGNGKKKILEVSIMVKTCKYDQMPY